MKIPPPKPAQVIRYSYLWADEHAKGEEEGRKDRPAAIVMTLQSEGGDLQVVVVPITHSAPLDVGDALELSPGVKRVLGLDNEPSWVVLTEINVFSWPGPDLRPTGEGDEATVLYGYLPASVFRDIRDRLVGNIKAGKTRQVKRTS